MDYGLYGHQEGDEYIPSCEELEEQEEIRQKVIAAICVVSLLLGTFGIATVKRRNEKRENNERNASYITEANVNTKFYDWCLNAKDIDTIVYILEGKAYLYEFDEECLDLTSGVYKIINLNGEYQYIPTSMALSFPTHEEAEEYAKQIVGEENIVCANYPQHNSVKTRKLVP